MKSLRRAGRCVAVARRLEMGEAALERRRVGQHRKAGRAASLDRPWRAPRGSKSARITPFDGLAFLISAISAKRPSTCWRSIALAGTRAADRLVAHLALQRLEGHAHLRLGDFAPLVGFDLAQDVRHVAYSDHAFDTVDKSLQRRARLGHCRSRVWAMATPSARSRAAPAMTRAAAALKTRDVAIGVCARLRARPASAAALWAGSPPLSSAGVGARQADILGRDLEGTDLAVVQFDDLGRPGRRYLVEPVGAMDEPDALRAEIAQHLGHRPQPGRRKHADQLPFDAGRVGQRAEQVEDRARAELDARRRRHGALRHDGVCAIMKPMPASLMQARRRRAARPILTPSAASTSARARLGGGRAIAVLGDRHAAAGDDQRRQRRDIVGAGTVAAGADDVDRVRGRFDAQHLGAHGGHGAGDFVDGFAADPKRHQEAAHLRGVTSPESMASNAVSASSRAQPRARGDLRDQGLERIPCSVRSRSVGRGGARSNASRRSRKFRACVLPCSLGDALGMELHAVRRARAVRQRHDQPVVGFGGHLRVRAARLRASTTSE